MLLEAFFFFLCQSEVCVFMFLGLPDKIQDALALFGTIENDLVFIRSLDLMGRALFLFAKFGNLIFPPIG